MEKHSTGFSVSLGRFILSAVYSSVIPNIFAVLSELCINEINDAKKAADNMVKAIEQGIITDFTKDRLTTLQNEVNNLDIEINRKMQKTYAHLSVDEVEKYLLSKVFENPDDIKTRKLLVNTFIREIIWYGDKLVITYNFQEEAIPPRLTKSHTEEVEKQVEEAARSASSFSLGSYIFWQTAPKQRKSFRCFLFVRSPFPARRLRRLVQCTLTRLDTSVPRRSLPAFAVRQVLLSAPSVSVCESFLTDRHFYFVISKERVIIYL